jgi:hypothetical protein
VLLVLCGRSERALGSGNLLRFGSRGFRRRVGSCCPLGDVSLVLTQVAPIRLELSEAKLEAWNATQLCEVSRGW